MFIDDFAANLLLSFVVTESSKISYHLRKLQARV